MQSGTRLISLPNFTSTFLQSNRTRAPFQYIKLSAPFLERTLLMIFKCAPVNNVPYTCLPHVKAFYSYESLSFKTLDPCTLETSVS